MHRKSLLTIGSLIALAVVAIVVVVLFRRPASPPSDREVRIAAILSLSGPAAQFDAVKQPVLEIAAERVRQLYPDVPIALNFYDAGGGPDAATVAVRRARQWGAQYFLSGTSPTALAIAAQVRGATPSVVQMANAANPEFGPPRPGEYRLWPDWQQEARLVADLLVSQRHRRVLVIHSADPYSESLKQSLEQEVARRSDLAVVYQQFDPASAPDFRPALTRAKADSSTAVVVFGLPPGIRTLISQMQQVRWEGAVIGGVNINLTEADFAASGLPGPLWSIQTPAMSMQLPVGSEAAAFRSAYVARHGESPPFHALYLADALYLIAAATQQSPGPDPVATIRQAPEFESASGQLRLSPENLVEYPMEPTRLYPQN